KQRETMSVKSGSLMLAGKTFDIPEQSFKEPQGTNNNLPPILAHHQAGDTRYTLAIHDHRKGDRFSCRLTADPEMPLDEIVARIYFGKTVEDLTAEEKPVWEKTRARFTE
ncbi:MAG: hypothetical protein AAF492_15275, partial [Verrucomicrobiota bacterium]